MADDTELPPEAGTETIDAPPEGETTEQQPDPIEALAGEMGWAPQDQFRGPPEEWKPAAEFIKAGREITRSVTRKLHSMEEQLSRVTATSSQILTDKLAEKDAHWQNVLARAVEDGDHKAASQAVGEIVKLKAEAPAATGAAPLPSDTADFMERHKSWMGKDPLATMRAEELANQLAQRGVPIPEQLVQVERAIRREFPEHFAAANGKPPPGVQTGQQRNAGKGSGKKGVADMPAEAQAMAKDYLERHGVPLEKFAESYWADQARNERRVG